jgi:hypothetical protein
MKKYLGFLSIGAMILATACSASVGTDGDATDDATASDSTVADTTGADTTAGDTTTADTTTKQTFKSVLIFDKSEDPTFVNGKCGSSPGSDIDAIALWRKIGTTWTLMGVGKAGSANYDTSKASTCDNKKNIPASSEGPINGKVFKSNPDTGYISLNGGSLELQIGACQSATEDESTCDGAGAIVDIMDGDQLDVFEVDKTYLPTGEGLQKGFAYDGCVCYADEYQVMLRTEKGVDAGSIFLGDAGGSTYKGTQSGGLAAQNTIYVVIP